MDKARYTATKAVVRLHRGGWANLTAKAALDAAGLNAQSRAFAAALFYGTAERLVTLDYMLRPHLKKPLEKLDVEVHAVLQTGLYQLVYMDVPARAAVNEAVNLARVFGKSSAAGMVNAVLRRAAEVSTRPMAFSSELERVCVTWSLSAPVAKAVMQALPDEYAAFLEASFAKGETCLRVNTLKTTVASVQSALAQAGGHVRPGSLPLALYTEIPGGPARQPFFAEGLYHIQGEASQYVCEALAVQKGERVLDLCAAPGGKSATLAQQLGGGQGLTACDVRENRVPLIRETFARLGIQGAMVAHNDATVYNNNLCGQNAVLCDVPCSGLGVMAAKPDIRYNGGQNFEALPPLQLDILRTGACYVKKGGRLVYSTCTIREEENGVVVRKFLEENSDFRPVLPQNIPAGAQIKDDMVTILPHKTNLDGFFVATLERL